MYSLCKNYILMMETLNNLFTGLITSLPFTVEPNGSSDLFMELRISKPLEGMSQFSHKYFIVM
jgi:hypothetical protein